MSLQLGANEIAVLYVMPGYLAVGQSEPEYAALLRSAPALYQTLHIVQKLLVTLLETADIIQDHTISLQLERITSAVDLSLKFARQET
jgi:hypothetical protein